MWKVEPLKPVKLKEESEFLKMPIIFQEGEKKVFPKGAKLEGNESQLLCSAWTEAHIWKLIWAFPSAGIVSRINIIKKSSAMDTEA